MPLDDKKEEFSKEEFFDAINQDDEEFFDALTEQEHDILDRRRKDVNSYDLETGALAINRVNGRIISVSFYANDLDLLFNRNAFFTANPDSLTSNGDRVVLTGGGATLAYIPGSNQVTFTESNGNQHTYTGGSIPAMPPTRQPVVQPTSSSPTGASQAPTGQPIPGPTSSSPSVASQAPAVPPTTRQPIPAPTSNSPTARSHPPTLRTLEPSARQPTDASNSPTGASQAPVVPTTTRQPVPAPSGQQTAGSGSGPESGSEPIQPTDASRSPTAASSSPTDQPIPAPTSQPVAQSTSNSPTAASSSPTDQPVAQPTDASRSPTAASSSPTDQPIPAPTRQPAAQPTDASRSPTDASQAPTSQPVVQPAPSDRPTADRATSSAPTFVNPTRGERSSAPTIPASSMDNSGSGFDSGDPLPQATEGPSSQRAPTGISPTFSPAGIGTTFSPTGRTALPRTGDNNKTGGLSDGIAAATVVSLMAIFAAVAAGLWYKNKKSPILPRDTDNFLNIDRGNNAARMTLVETVMSDNEQDKFHGRLAELCERIFHHSNHIDTNNEGEPHESEAHRYQDVFQNARSLFRHALEPTSIPLGVLYNLDTAAQLVFANLTHLHHNMQQGEEPDAAQIAGTLNASLQSERTNTLLTFADIANIESEIRSSTRDLLATLERPNGHPIRLTPDLYEDARVQPPAHNPPPPAHNAPRIPTIPANANDPERVLPPRPNYAPPPPPTATTQPAKANPQTTNNAAFQAPGDQSVRVGSSSIPSPEDRTEEDEFDIANQVLDLHANTDTAKQQSLSLRTDADLGTQSNALDFSTKNRDKPTTQKGVFSTTALDSSDDEVDEIKTLAQKAARRGKERRKAVRQEAAQKKKSGSLQPQDNTGATPTAWSGPSTRDRKDLTTSPPQVATESQATQVKPYSSQLAKSLEESRASSAATTQEPLQTLGRKSSLKAQREVTPLFGQVPETTDGIASSYALEIDPLTYVPEYKELLSQVQNYATGHTIEDGERLEKYQQIANLATMIHGHYVQEEGDALDQSMSHFASYVKGNERYAGKATNDQNNVRNAAFEEALESLKEGKKAIENLTVHDAISNTYHAYSDQEITSRSAKRSELEILQADARDGRILNTPHDNRLRRESGRSSLLTPNQRRNAQITSEARGDEITNSTGGDNHTPPSRPTPRKLPKTPGDIKSRSRHRDTPRWPKSPNISREGTTTPTSNIATAEHKQTTSFNLPPASQQQEDKSPPGTPMTTFKRETLMPSTRERNQSISDRGAPGSQDKHDHRQAIGIETPSLDERSRSSSVSSGGSQSSYSSGSENQSPQLRRSSQYSTSTRESLSPVQYDAAAIQDDNYELARSDSTSTTPEAQSDQEIEPFYDNASPGSTSTTPEVVRPGQGVEAFYDVAGPEAQSDQEIEPLYDVAAAGNVLDNQPPTVSTREQENSYTLADELDDEPTADNEDAAPPSPAPKNPGAAVASPKAQDARDNTGGRGGKSATLVMTNYSEV